MFSKAALKFYRLFHHNLGLPGAGWLLRRLARVLPPLRSCALRIPSVGTAIVDLRDDSAYSLLNFSLGERDNHEHLLELMLLAIPEAGVVWDVGANVGEVSAWLASRSARVVSIQAFEPAPGPLRTLESLFKDHSIVRVHPVGLGDKDERKTIQSCPTSSALNSLRRTLPGSVPIDIQIHRGDTVCKELGLPMPHVLKVDVEGFEREVLAGLADTIAVARPVILFEHIMLSDEEVLALRPDGYQLQFQLEDGTLTADISRRMSGHNAVLLPAGHSLLLEKEPRD